MALKKSFLRHNTLQYLTSEENPPINCTLRLTSEQRFSANCLKTCHLVWVVYEICEADVLSFHSPCHTKSELSV